MDALHCLRVEHSGILIGLEILETVWERMNEGKAVDLDHLHGTVEILTVLNHQCHEVKEEALLFPAMERAGVPRRGGVLDLARLGHCALRSIMLQMGMALQVLQDGDQDARAMFMEASRYYVAILRDHVFQEKDVIFPLAEKVVPGQCLGELAADLEKIDEECTGSWKRERLPGLTTELSKTYLQGFHEATRRTRLTEAWRWRRRATSPGELPGLGSLNSTRMGS